MALSLHQAIIPNWLQVLGAVDGLIDKAENFVADGHAEEKALLETRLIDDMLPLAYQFKSCWTHTHLALTAIREGHFSPDMSPYPEDFASLRSMVATARETCEATSEDELEALAGNDMVFAIGDKFRLDFTVQDFLLSFSNPNVYFHSATAYDILRMAGVGIGKRDFLGALRVKQTAG
ncbi:DUF1993 domain-containing protein [Citromicrobium bathyomarinum]|uniref:DUF1993 domain-containing protein n=1 Tax=Sphingomonadales TaxID=204457 RepID=UPI000C533D24|nr:hypothetical protein [Citromicrobium sp.]|tara:strand:+ start:92 stop:625 length:534 start_codon:yes stop_codon:yes gene_type:complete